MQRIIDTLELDKNLNKHDELSLPPIEKWHPEKITDSEMLIDADGKWFHQDGEIKRIPLCKLFASILRKEDDNEYYLITPPQKFHIKVVDVPFVLSTVFKKDIDGQSSLLFVNSLNEQVILNAEHPLELRDYDGVSVPYIKIRDQLYARVSRSCFYHLIELAQLKNTDDRHELHVESQGQSFFIGDYDANS